MFKRREILHTRKGNWFFRCRRCRFVDFEHYYRSSAYADQARHRCPNDPKCQMAMSGTGSIEGE